MKNSRTHSMAILLLAGPALLSVGCAAVKKAYEPNPTAAPMRIVAPEAKVAWVQPTHTDGSIWNNASEAMFADNKAFRPGDIVQVRVIQKNTGAKNAGTDTSRKSSISAKIKYLFGFEDSINKLAGAKTNTSITDATGSYDPHNQLEASSENSFQGSGATKRSDTLEATVSAVVTDVLPNGNLVIYGTQTVTLNSEASVLTVQGVVRPSDLSRDNIVDSTRIANADIQFTGSGVVSDKQHPGLGMRVFDWVWPF